MIYKIKINQNIFNNKFDINFLLKVQTEQHEDWNL